MCTLQVPTLDDKRQGPEERRDTVSHPQPTLAVVGVGLIGGSFALAAREAGLVGRVIGIGRSAANLQAAIDLEVIDAASHDIAAVAAADIVLVATPVGQMAGLFDSMAPHLKPGTVVTDAGSTKSDVTALFRAHLPAHLQWCVPAHPIAGSDQSGAAAARAGLYVNRKVVLAPLPETRPEALECVETLWRACGARVETMSAEEHDAVFAAVSHLPHLLAFAYVDMVAGKANAQRYFDFAATGFRDFTRIAGSHPEMWRDIALANRAALLDELASYQASLARLTALVESADAAAMESLFEEAREARVKWHERFEASR
ncbi:prephenate dehydrogenase/arogenate dehydrogenase family protein [Crenobacter cavernae]|uniref:prephenate dehydrogenase n=1 Tax=Crenobacter cavernae TaxID=2290923 RepID=A0A345Y706_9NEIS|nr:prephenate dehydrogenase/arogenate dehydrogenase family protein [Crenobacter cavernae]